MDVELFDFPTLKDGRVAVEQRFCELVNKYRKGEQLPVEAIDWMDSANTWLMTVGSKL